jgi:4-hydroxybenzoate polyprenyltransferase
MRIANLPTAISNVAAGLFLALPPLELQSNSIDIQMLIAAVFVSAFLYVSGMILNDAFDAEVDTVERPNRPIPSGKVAQKTAFQVGFGMIVLAIAIPATLLMCDVITGVNGRASSLLGLLETSVALAICIVLYDGPLKKTWLAAPLMGCCRMLNVLLGVFAMAHSDLLLWHAATDQPWFVYAFLIGLLVTGITLLARSETKTRQSRFWLTVGAATMLVALTSLFRLPHFVRFALDISYLTTKQAYWAMLAIIVFPVVQRLIVAVRTATPQAVGPAIGTSLTSLIFLDAAVCFLVRPDQPLYAGAVALLIIPVMILRRFSAQT